VGEGIRKGASITGERRRELAAELRAGYEAGLPVRALAAGTGRSYGWVHQILAESGVAFRSRGGPRRHPPAPARPPAE